MNEQETPTYPRGFVLRHDGRGIPPGWRQSALFPGLHYDPDAPRAAASLDGADVELFGTCVPVDRPISASFDPAADLAASLKRGETEFLAHLGRCAGRHAVFFRRPAGAHGVGPPSVVGDATGLRPLFYALEPQPVVASHAPLAVADPVASGKRDTELPVKWGYPGNGTPFHAVRLLTPNTLLDLGRKRLRRFFPSRVPPALTVEEAARDVSGMVKRALRNFTTRYGSLRLGVTAGIDSRTTLALAVGAGVDFDGFTYLTGDADTGSDVEAARSLAQIAGIRHFVLDVRDKVLTPAKARKYDRISYYRHAPKVVEGMSEAGSWPTFLSSNLLEIGRAYYFGKGLPEPTSPEGAVRLYVRLAHKQGFGKRIEAFGAEAYRDRLLAEFENFFDETGFTQSFGFLTPFDAFYWEHRMAAWHGVTTLERDFACDTFIAFNCRAVFEALLGVDRAFRKSSAVFKRMIEREAPALLSMPFNAHKAAKQTGPASVPPGGLLGRV